MSLRLYDTAKRSKVSFAPKTPQCVGVYVCGPTVYDYCHIGHARCYVAFDVVIRHLQSLDYDVTYVRNITDIDDKIINRARDEGHDPLVLADRFAAEFSHDMQQLGCLTPSQEPKVSEHMPQIVTFIERLITQNIAYPAEGDVYFSVKAFEHYGCLSGRSLDEMRAGARVEINPKKKNALDFALWKASPDSEIGWDSPWGRGRPGWHIECSAMSQNYLGDTFDIHGGGMDLIFPHHENELAQSQACTGPDSFVRYWMHNGFVNIKTADDEQEKMSKSLGNFFTIRQVIERHEPEALRLYLLSTHYRKPIQFEVEGEGDTVRFPGLEEAERRVAYYYETLQRLDHLLASMKPPSGEGAVLDAAARFEKDFASAMNDDFNSAAALGYLAEMMRLGNQLVDGTSGVSKKMRKRTLFFVKQQLDKACFVLGILTQQPDTVLLRRRDKLCALKHVDPQWVEEKIEQRRVARRAKDYAKSDTIRDELLAKGVTLKDGAGETTWTLTE